MNRNYFDLMLKDIYLNEISTKRFFEYYHHLKQQLSKSVIDNSLEYVIGLKKSKVENPDTIDDELLLYNCKKDLDNLLEKVIKNILKNNRIDLENYLEVMKNNINDSKISLDEYYNYNEVLTLAIMLDENSENFEYANVLYNAQVGPINDYHDQLRYTRYQEKLSNKIKKFERYK